MVGWLATLYDLIILRWLVARDIARHIDCVPGSTTLLPSGTNSAAPFISRISSPAKFIIGQLLLTLSACRESGAASAAASGKDSGEVRIDHHDHDQQRRAGLGCRQNVLQHATFNLTQSDDQQRSSSVHFINTVISDDTTLHLLDEYSNRTAPIQRFAETFNVNT